MVVGAAMLVALIGMASLMSLRIERRTLEGTLDAAEARIYAQSAIELGMQRIKSDPAWRATQPNGNWFVERPMGAGTICLSGVDPDDAQLDNDDTGLLILTGIGKRGDAEQRVQVTLVPKLRGVSALEAALHAGSTLSFNAATVTADGKLSSNGAVTAGSSQINAPVESVLGSSGGSYNQTDQTLDEPRTMPVSSVFDPYASAGTAIALSSIPAVAGTKTIEKVVLSSASNPYGSQTNGQGIYVVDCQNQAIRVRDCRILGTLVLLNTGANSKVANSVHWDAAAANYPALLVKGSISLEYNAADLNEATLSANFNPAGTPYQGASDAANDDAYPSRIKGLIYASDAMDLANQPAIEGAVLAAGNVTVAGTVSLSYKSVYLTDPPPGFVDTTLMKVSAGSWRKTVQ